MTYTMGLDRVREAQDILNLDAETLGYVSVPDITVYCDYDIHYSDGVSTTTLSMLMDGRMWTKHPFPKAGKALASKCR